jgi:hypothetical protein
VSPAVLACGVVAALFVAVLAAPALMASAITTNHHGAVLLSAGASGAKVATGNLPASLLVSQNATSYSLDTNGVAPIAATLGTPGEIFHSIGNDLINALITILIILFIAFPANIFNQTLSENYDEIQLMKENARRKVRSTLGLPATASTAPTPNAATPLLESGPNPASAAVAGDASIATAATEGDVSPVSSANAAVEGSSTPEIAKTPDDTTEEMPGRATRPWFLATLAVGGLFGGLLDPHFGANAHSFESFLSTMVAFAVGAIVSWFVAKTFRSRLKYPTDTYLKALPLGLAVAFGCVVVSRLTHFEPGYLYGVVISISFVASMKDRHNAHLIVISTLSTLSVALLAWFLWIPVNHVALEAGGNFIETILDDVLASMFIGGLIGSVIGLLPLEGLPGGSLVKWRRDVWAGVIFLAIFLLISVELRPSSGPTHPGGAPVFTAIVLFLAFGGLSFGTRSYFQQRKHHKEPAPES